MNEGLFSSITKFLRRRTASSSCWSAILTAARRLATRLVVTAAVARLSSLRLTVVLLPPITRTRLTRLLIGDRGQKENRGKDRYSLFFFYPLDAISCRYSSNAKGAGGCSSSFSSSSVATAGVGSASKPSSSCCCGSSCSSFSSKLTRRPKCALSNSAAVGGSETPNLLKKWRSRLSLSLCCFFNACGWSGDRFLMYFFFFSVLFFLLKGE